MDSGTVSCGQTSAAVSMPRGTANCDQMTLQLQFRCLPNWGQVELPTLFSNATLPLQSHLQLRPSGTALVVAIRPQLGMPPTMHWCRKPFVRSEFKKSQMD